MAGGERSAARRPSPEPAPTRRAVLGALLAGAGLAALTACGGKDGAQPPGPAPEPTPDPDTELIAEALADKRELLARYAATLARFPGLSTGLAAGRADHEGHSRALAASPLAPAGALAATSTPETPTPDDSASPDPSASPAPTAPSVPAERGAAVRALAAAERSAAEARLAQCVAARDAGLARLLASVGACEAAHAVLLGDLAELAS